MESVNDCVNGSVMFEGDDHSWSLVGDIGRWIKKAETQPRWEMFDLIRSPVRGIIGSELDDRVEVLQGSD